MSQAALREAIAEITREISGRALDADLDAWLNREHGVGTPSFERLRHACRQGVGEGWLCQRDGGGIRYGRVFKASDDLHRFSVDVVDMKDIAGPHHMHPNGEIDLILPMDDGAQFDGRPAGWCVYEPGSAHHPTVSSGRSLVLYLLPEGAIEFTPATVRSPSTEPGKSHV